VKKIEKKRTKVSYGNPKSFVIFNAMAHIGYRIDIYPQPESAQIDLETAWTKLIPTHDLHISPREHSPIADRHKNRRETQNSQKHIPIRTITLRQRTSQHSPMSTTSQTITHRHRHRRRSNPMGLTTPVNVMARLSISTS